MTIEAQLSEINGAGWFVSDLYQRDHDQWFASLRQRGDFSAATGKGETMGEALASAWVSAKSHKRMTNADWQKVEQPARKPSIPRIR